MSQEHFEKYWQDKGGEKKNKSKKKSEKQIKLPCHARNISKKV